jgi:hypothetical protein
LLPYKLWVDDTMVGKFSKVKYEVVLFSLCGLPYEEKQKKKSWLLYGFIPYLLGNFNLKKIN